MLEFSDLFTKFDLGPGKVLELVDDFVECGSLKIFRIGIVWKSDERAEPCFASAADLNSERCKLRSYFELVERFTLSDPLISNRAITASSSDWRLARSSGVAAHVDRLQAMRSSALELCERDSILRCWHGLEPLRKLLSNTKIHPELQKRFDFEFFKCGSDSNCIAEVLGEFKCSSVMAVGWPKDSGVDVLAIGFGCESDLSLACNKAMNECLQRIAFLNPNDLDLDWMTRPISPQTHLECFLQESGMKTFRAWLDSSLEFETMEPSNLSEIVNSPERSTSGPSLAKQIHFEFLASGELERNFWVCRATGDEHVPLYFGCSLKFSEQHPLLQGKPGFAQFHPIA